MVNLLDITKKVFTKTIIISIATLFAISTFSTTAGATIQETVRNQDGSVSIKRDFNTPNSVTIENATGGDGFRAVPTEDKVYTIYHHSLVVSGEDAGADLADAYCIIKATGQYCPGYPKAIQVGGKHIATEEQSSGVVDYNKNRLYFAAATDSASGIVCLDLKTGEVCSGFGTGGSGFLAVDPTPPPSVPAFGTYWSRIHLISFDHEDDFSDFDGTLRYIYKETTSSTSSKSGCVVVESSLGGSCPSSSATLPLSGDGFFYGNPYGDRVYWTYQATSDNNQIHLGCYDRAANNACGFPNSIDFNVVYPEGTMAPVYIPSLNKVCLSLYGANTTTNKFGCANMSSGAVTLNSSGNSNLDSFLPKIFGEDSDPDGDSLNTALPSYWQEKIYLANDGKPNVTDKDMYCWDDKAQRECTEFSGGVDWSTRMEDPGLTRDYTYSVDRYTNYQCAWAVGDKRHLIPFRLDGNTDLGACGASFNNLRVNLLDHICKVGTGLKITAKINGLTKEQYSTQIESVLIRVFNINDTVRKTELAKFSYPPTSNQNPLIDLSTVNLPNGIIVDAEIVPKSENTLWSNGSAPSLELHIPSEYTKLKDAGCYTSPYSPTSQNRSSSWSLYSNSSSTRNGHIRI